MKLNKRCMKWAALGLGAVISLGSVVTFAGEVKPALEKNPGSLAVAKEAGIITLTWDEVADDRVATLVYETKDKIVPVIVPKGQNTLIFDDLDEEEAYQFVIRAIGNKGEVSDDDALTAAIKAEVERDTTTPSELTMTLGQDAKTTRGFNWYTNTEVKDSVLQLVEGKDFVAGKAKNIQGTNRTVKTSMGDRMVHEVTLNTLKPGTTYSYRVGSAKENAWSEMGSFTTEAKNTEAFTFVYGTDTQGKSVADGEIGANTLEKALAQYPDAAFMIHAGDHVNEAYHELQWKWYLNPASSTLKDLAMMPVVGNHEAYTSGEIDGITRFQDHFNLPTNGQGGQSETVYSYNYGDVHFASLNTEVSMDELEEQMEWLKKDVKAANKRWNIVTLHKGPYLSKRDLVDYRELMVPVFDELGIDIVLQGHDHTYIRTAPLKGGEEVADGEGTVYLLGNTAGYKFYDVKERPYHKIHQQDYQQMFMGFEVSKDAIAVNAYTVDGVLQDSFKVTK
ncbi:MAG: fibronectin type III domain-containing protein [Cellulosilyticaceae bacterium]